MKNTLKILFVFAAFGLSWVSASGKTSTTKRPSYEVKKDTLLHTTVIDTNKKTVTFPNPFNVFIIREVKSTKE